MNIYRHGFAHRKGAIAEQQVLASVFPDGYVEIPYQLIDRGSKFCKFSEEDTNCLMIIHTNNFTYLFSKSLLDCFDFSQPVVPAWLQGLEKDWIFFQSSMQEFYWQKEKELPKFRYQQLDNAVGYIETQDNIQLAKSIKEMTSEIGDDGVEYFIITQENDNNNEEIAQKEDLPTMVTLEVLKEFFGFQDMERSLNIKCYLAANPQTESEYFYDYTGLMPKAIAENRIENSKSNLRFGSDMFQHLTQNNSNKPVIGIIKNLLQLPFILLVILFNRGNNQELEARFDHKLGYIVYGITLLTLLITVNLIKVNTIYDIVKFFGMIIIGIFLSTRFLKILLLKKVNSVHVLK